MIMCFSGTGNSRYVAKCIAEITGDRILDLNCLIKQGGRITETQDDSLVIVSPTYAWRLPRIVEQSVRNAELHPRCRAWFVMTCGDEIGNAGRYNAQLCANRGLTYMGTAGIVMPENYLAMFEVPDAGTARQIIHEAVPEIRRAAGKIVRGEAFSASHVSLLDWFKSQLVNPVFYALLVRARAFRTDARCVGCGKCTEVCPMNNIRLQAGRPVWGADCTHCMACICRCPQEAIEYGNRSKGKSRYLCENALDQETVEST